MEKSLPGMVTKFASAQPAKISTAPHPHSINTSATESISHPPKRTPLGTPKDTSHYPEQTRDGKSTHDHDPQHPKSAGTEWSRKPSNPKQVPIHYTATPKPSQAIPRPMNHNTQNWITNWLAFTWAILHQDPTSFTTLQTNPTPPKPTGRIHPQTGIRDPQNQPPHTNLQPQIHHTRIPALPTIHYPGQPLNITRSEYKHTNIKLHHQNTWEDLLSYLNESPHLLFETNRSQTIIRPKRSAPPHQIHAAHQLHHQYLRGTK